MEKDEQIYKILYKERCKTCNDVMNSLKNKSPEEILIGIINFYLYTIDGYEQTYRDFFSGTEKVADKIGYAEKVYQLKGQIFHIYIVVDLENKKTTIDRDKLTALKRLHELIEKRIRNYHDNK